VDELGTLMVRKMGELGLHQLDVARAIGASQGHFSKIFNGKCRFSEIYSSALAVVLQEPEKTIKHLIGERNLRISEAEMFKRLNTDIVVVPDFNQELSSRQLQVLEKIADAVGGKLSVRMLLILAPLISE